MSFWPWRLIYSTGIGSWVKWPRNCALWIEESERLIDPSSLKPFGTWPFPFQIRWRWQNCCSGAQPSSTTECITRMDDHLKSASNSTSSFVIPEKVERVGVHTMFGVYEGMENKENPKCSGFFEIISSEHFTRTSLRHKLQEGTAIEKGCGRRFSRSYSRMYSKSLILIRAWVCT